MYNVVFKIISENAVEDSLVCTSFKNKEEFEAWYDDEMRSEYTVFEEDVSDARATELCTYPKAKFLDFAAYIQRTIKSQEGLFVSLN